MNEFIQNDLNRGADLITEINGKQKYPNRPHRGSTTTWNIQKKPRCRVATEKVCGDRWEKENRKTHIDDEEVEEKITSFEQIKQCSEQRDHFL